MQAKRKSGFTIVELLVVIGVITLLLSLLLPALASIKASGRQTVELSAARQLMGAYAAYSAAHKDSLLPGYVDRIPDSPTGRIIRAFDPRGAEITGGQLSTARQRWVWRLAPYMKFDVRGMYPNGSSELLESLEQQNYADFLYKVSVSPALGLNSEWVGGDRDASGFLRPDHPLRNVLDFNSYYVSAMAQVQHPNKLLVFASSRGVDPDNAAGPPIEGYFRIQSPYFTALQPLRWSAEFNAGEPPVNYGFISPRYGGKSVTAFIDGHTEMLDKVKIRDMRYWANWATAADWKLPQLTP